MTISLDCPPRPHLGRAEKVHEVDIAELLHDCIQHQFHSRDADNRFFLYSRELASELVSRLRPHVQRLPQDEVLLLWLDKIRITAEFAEQAVSDLVCRGTPITRILKERIVVLADPDEGTTISLHRALEAEKDACLVWNTHPKPLGELLYIGNVQPHLVTLLDYIHSRNKTTSKDVAERFNYKLSDASGRLKELYEDGMIRRAPVVNLHGKLTFEYTYFHPVLEYRPETPADQLKYRFYAL